MTRPNPHQLRQDSHSKMETYYGLIKSPADAVKLFEACRLGILPRVQRRLSEKERQLIRPGSVFVWDEREAGMRRWTDGKSWSASRVSGSFLTYREMEGKRGAASSTSTNSGSVASPGRKDCKNGKVGKDDTDGNEGNEGNDGNDGKDGKHGKDDKNGKDQGASDDDQEETEPDGYRYKTNGLVKQSFSITTYAGQHLHLISYHLRPLSGGQDLIQPTADMTLRNVLPPKHMYPDSCLTLPFAETVHAPALTSSPLVPRYTDAAPSYLTIRRQHQSVHNVTAPWSPMPHNQYPVQQPPSPDPAHYVHYLPHLQSYPHQQHLVLQQQQQLLQSQRPQQPQQVQQPHQLQQLQQPQQLRRQRPSPLHALQPHEPTKSPSPAYQSTHSLPSSFSPYQHPAQGRFKLLPLGLPPARALTSPTLCYSDHQRTGSSQPSSPPSHSRSRSPSYSHSRSASLQHLLLLPSASIPSFTPPITSATSGLSSTAAHSAARSTTSAFVDPVPMSSPLRRSISLSPQRSPAAGCDSLPRSKLSLFSLLHPIPARAATEPLADTEHVAGRPRTSAVSSSPPPGLTAALASTAPVAAGGRVSEDSRALRQLNRNFLSSATAL